MPSTSPWKVLATRTRASFAPPRPPAGPSPPPSTPNLPGARAGWVPARSSWGAASQPSISNVPVARVGMLAPFVSPPGSPQVYGVPRRLHSGKGAVFALRTVRRRRRRQCRGGRAAAARGGSTAGKGPFSRSGRSGVDDGDSAAGDADRLVVLVRYADLPHLARASQVGRDAAPGPGPPPPRA